VIVDTGAVFHFFQMNHVLAFSSRRRAAFACSNLKLPIVHDLDDRGPGERRDFYEIQAPFGCGAIASSIVNTPAGRRCPQSRATGLIRICD